jgi:GLPGLI family protein
MKIKLSKIATLIVFITCVTSMNAQQFSGKAYYKSHKKMKMLLDSSKYDKKTVNDIQNVFAKQFQRDHILEFNRTESIFSEQVEIDIRGNSNNLSGKLYKNFITSRYIHKKELLGKVFSIQDSIKIKKWNITNTTKNIGKYKCYKATFTFKENDSTDVEVVAWFTNQIPVNNGPALYDGLPGLILELNDGKYSYLCNKIELSKEKIKLKRPRGGSIVSESEFEKILKKKQKEGRRKARDFLKVQESSKN